MAKNVNLTTTPETIATSSRALAVSSSNFEQLKKDLTNIYENRTKLRKQLTKVKFNYFITYIFSSSEKRQDKKKLINKLAESLENTYININFRKSMKDAGSWDEAMYYFQELFQCCKIWDLTSRQDTDKFRQRTIADESLERKLITTRVHKSLEFIKSDVDNFYLPNLNGADIYIYPTFIILFKDYKKFSIHDLRNVEVSARASSFQEEQGVPKDSEIVGHTYKYTNKNGQPDKRFNNNYEIPVVRYGDFRLRSDSGINERYQFSDFSKFTDFAKALTNYLQANLKTFIER